MTPYSGETKDCIVIGGGQAGLACGYYLRKAKLDFLILDDQTQPGGAWVKTWDSLRIFSPPEQSSLPGYLMPKSVEDYPHKTHVINYLADYEKRYDLNIKRPIKVKDVDFDGYIYTITTTSGDTFTTRALICATGTWSNPYIPNFPGQNLFQGEIHHSATYKKPSPFSGKDVLIIGAGNSAAQIYADLYSHSNLYWVTKETPSFLPDYVDGRYLFNTATKRYKEFLNSGKKKAETHLGLIVQVEPVKKLLQEDKMLYYEMFDHFTNTGIVWKNGKIAKIDSAIFCTGFKSAISYLADLSITKNGRILTEGTKATSINGLWMVGFGDWTGYASATLIGVGRTAKKTVEQIKEFL